MDIYERLRQSEQSWRLAWQVLQEIRQVFGFLGDRRIPYEGEMKRFRAEGDFLPRALVNSITISRTHVHRLEIVLSELEGLARAGWRCLVNSYSQFTTPFDWNEVPV